VSTVFLCAFSSNHAQLIVFEPAMLQSQILSKSGLPLNPSHTHTRLFYLLTSHTHMATAMGLIYLLTLLIA